MPAQPALLVALLAQRCPVCRRGAIFSGWLELHPTCPACGLRFERESGYFLVAVLIGLQRRRSLRRYLGALDSLAGSSPRGAPMNIEYVIGLVGSVVTFIVAIGVFSYYEIEKIAQQEQKNKMGK